MIEGLLSDVHGVLYVYPRAIPGSVDAVNRLVRAGFPHLFLTNSSQHPKSWILRSLAEAGFDIDPKHVLTAVEAAGEYLSGAGLRRIGWLCVPELIEDLGDLDVVSPLRPGKERVDAVLVGDMGAGFTYEVLNQAFRWLHEGARLVAIARNRAYESQDGLVLDSGPFVSLLEDAADVQAFVAGKPSETFFRTALLHLGLPPASVAMVGDDLEADVLPAMTLGMEGILVRTGKFREHHYRVASTRADRLADDLSAVVTRLLA
ncbi:MAG TPA: HAD-IIA family hydrolase [Candidatus Eisenbacteria bacterium]|nr:HAD-IIA family hydrolase [Candidatus Eisenbacteria bacterium]